jgi:hypothetical protein
MFGQGKTWHQVSLVWQPEIRQAEVGFACGGSSSRRGCEACSRLGGIREVAEEFVVPGIFEPV